MKIGNIVGDVLGVREQEMVSVLVAGRDLPVEQIADLSQGKLCKKIPELKEALARHQMREHHRWLIQLSINHTVLLDQQMEALETRIQQKLKPYQQEYELWQTIPRVKEIAAASILAEIGPDMSRFPTAKQLGWDLSGQQPVGGEEQTRKDQERQPVSVGSAHAGGMGRRTEMRLDVPASVLPLEWKAGRGKGQSGDRA